MAVRGYKGFTLPEDLVAMVDRFVEKNQEGYRTRAEVVTAAIREFLDRHQGPRVSEQELESLVLKHLKDQLGKRDRPGKELSPETKKRIRGRGDD